MELAAMTVCLELIPFQILLRRFRVFTKSVSYRKAFVVLCLVRMKSYCVRLYTNSKKLVFWSHILVQVDLSFRGNLQHMM